MSYNPNNPNGQATGANSAPVVVASDQSALPVTGAFFQATQPVSSTQLPATLGAKTIANATAVSIASDQTLSASLPDLLVAGQAAQTAIVNNILTTTAGSAATDLTGYRSASIQIVSTGTAGTFIFEGSNDNVNFQSAPVYIQSTTTGVVTTTALTASVSQFIYSLPLSFQYLRLRIVTTITGGSIRAFSRFSQATWTPAMFQVMQNSGTSLVTQIASGTVTTVSSVTSNNSAIPLLITDVASAALTTTTTTATVVPSSGCSYTVNVPVTVVSGTTPTLDIQIQESPDTGTNWFTVYTFPRITATGSYTSPAVPLTGNRVRYVQTVGGTTPSFTRALLRLQSSSSVFSAVRQIIDRTVAPNTLNSVTPSLVTQNLCSFAQLVLNLGAVTTPPSFQLEGSDDDGATWYAVGTPLAGVASSTVQVTVPNTSAILLRARVSTAGTGVTLGYALLKGF